MADQCLVTPNCDGHIVDGYCDVCGMQPVGGGLVAEQNGKSESHARGTQRTGSTQLSGASAVGSRRTSKGTKLSSSRRLGLGLVTIPEIPKADPLANLMPEAKVPENKRYCTGTKSDGTPCELQLTKEKCTKCGTTHEYHGAPRSGCKKCGGPCEIVAREKGFCSACGTPYDFRPKLLAGETLFGQYEISGAVAFGGMGWVYLGKDITLNRYVVVKGLLNSSDPNLAKAAIAERQFLAEVKHPNIVNVYTCVTDNGSSADGGGAQAYTIMEYVGGVTLKSLRKERGPLPVAEVLAYMYPVLLAFGYMHANGLIYNDFKPDNVMLEEGDIKVIDLGGVCRMTQADGDIYSTIGYAAPELNTLGPSAMSDLYTIGRTIAVLVTEFKGFQSTYKNSLKTPTDEPIYRQYDSLYRFLQKACHENPNMRFQSADEMAEQLVGVLREVVARDSGTVRVFESRIFGPDTLGMREVPDIDDTHGINVLDIDSLPLLKMNPEDQATNFILSNMGGGNPRRLKYLLTRAITQFPNSIEALFAVSRNSIFLGDYDDAEKYLAMIEDIDPFDWRVIWYRGLAYIAQGKPVEALKAFDTCYGEVPGELAVKLAIAIAAELSGDTAQAIHYYECIAKTDPGYATALFGLGRCLAATGKRQEAVDAFMLVGQTSSFYGDAQKAIAAALINNKPDAPGVTELARASATIEALMLDGAEGHRLVRTLLSTTLDLLNAGRVKPTPGVMLFGRELSDVGVRSGLELAYRNLAKLSEDNNAKISLVDIANKVRPRTLI